MEAKTRKTAGHSAMLLLAALVWGIAFVAQSEGLNYVGAFTFNTCRFILGGAVLIPCIYFLHGRKDSAWQTLSEKEKKEQTRMGIIGGICCGCILCLASCLQQFGIAQTTVGKAGFITTLYYRTVYGAVLKEKDRLQHLDQRGDRGSGHVFLMYHGVLFHRSRRPAGADVFRGIFGTYPGDRPFFPEGRWCGDFLRAVLYRRCDCKRADAAF